MRQPFQAIREKCPKKGKSQEGMPLPRDILEAEEGKSVWLTHNTCYNPGCGCNSVLGDFAGMHEPLRWIFSTAETWGGSTHL